MFGALFERHTEVGNAAVFLEKVGERFID